MIGFRKRLAAALLWIEKYCARSRVARSLVAYRSSSIFRSKSTPSQAIAPPVCFRRLEPRRVLSVNAAFAAGVLDIVIQDDGGSTDAALLSDDGVHFFVDANGDHSYDDGSSGGASELRGLLSELTQINVIGDAGVGNFLWRNDFTSSPLDAAVGNVVDISQVAAIELSAAAHVQGDVRLSASDSLHFAGDLSLTGDLHAQINSPSSHITNSAGASLEVVGHSDLTAHRIDLGNQAHDHFAFGSLRIASDGAVDISEDGSTSDTTTHLIGSSTAHSWHLANNGSITLESGATITVDGDVRLQAIGAEADLQLSGRITATDGSIDLIAAQSILLNADIDAHFDLHIEAGENFTQTTSSATAGDNLHVISGATQRLALLSADHLALDAGGDILDNNGADTLNLRGNSLLISAGGMVGAPDISNAPDANSHALDLAVNRVAASSVQGIYLQQLTEASDLTLDNLTTTAGPIKVVVRGGELVIKDGIDGDGIGVRSAGASDILLWATANLDIQAQVVSGGGHVSLHAGNDVNVAGGVSTTGSGSVYLAGRDVIIDASVSTAAGDQLLSATRDLRLAALSTSASGSVGLLAGRDMTHTGSVTAGGDVLIDAGRDLHAGNGSLTAGENLLIQVGSDSVRGTMTLGMLKADQQAWLIASGDILDGNAGGLNVQADALSLRAEGIGTPSDLLDVAVSTIAAEADSGIYLRQLSTDLTIGHVDAGTVRIDVQLVHFNSSLSPMACDVGVDGLDDLQTQTGRGASAVAIEVHVVAGDLLVTDGQDADDRGILVLQTGAIVLQTSQAGSIGLQTGIETRDLGSSGNIQLVAAEAIYELARTDGADVSDATVIAQSLSLRAGQHAHLHNVDVNTLSAQVGANGMLNDDWQRTNALANDKGDDFLDQLGADRQSYAESAGVMTEVDRSISDTRLSAVRQSYAEIARQFRFEDTYQGQYALFLRNTKTLELLDVTAGAASNSPSATAAPTIYIETLGAASNLNVTRTIATHSSTDTEGGIVLVAGGKLNMNGALETESRLETDVFRTQRVERIGTGLTQNAMGQAAVGYLNGHVFNGGDGLPPGDLFLTSSQFVIRDQAAGLSALAEDYRTHVFQRVVAQYGFAGEAGFVTFVGYADGEIQQFDVLGEAGARTKRFDQTNSLDQSALPAATVPLGQATAFSRATAFDPRFLDANQELATVAIARRAADFFLFENAAADQSSDIRDLTVESFRVDNVYALGAQGATEMPHDPAPIQPPDISIVVPPTLLSNPVQLVRNDIELQMIPERSIEVAIFQVYFEDENENGQADADELPSEQEILAAEIVDREFDPGQTERLEPHTRILLEVVHTESGGSPTAEDIDELKSEFLEDPQRPSGAYAIIEKGVDDKEVVLDVFSIRDVDETDQPFDPEAERPLIQLPNSESVPNHQPSQPQPDAQTGAQTGARNDSRFAQAALVASSLWLARTGPRAQVVSAKPSQSPMGQANPPIAFDRRARRRRRLQRYCAPMANGDAQ